MEMPMSKLLDALKKSGVIDRHMEKMFERWGMLGLPNDSSRTEFLAREQEDLEVLAEEISCLVESKKEVHEAVLDLDHLRWPVLVRVGGIHSSNTMVMMRDSAGTLFARIDCVPNEKDWYNFFHPGQRIFISDVGFTDSFRTKSSNILETTQIFSGETPIAFRIIVE